MQESDSLETDVRLDGDVQSAERMQQGRKLLHERSGLSELVVTVRKWAFNNRLADVLNGNMLGHDGRQTLLE